MNDGKNGFWYRIASGILIALGLVIPGVSGALLAMVLGVYEPLIAAVAKPFSNWRQNVRLVFPLLLGVLLCLLLFTRLLEYLFAQHPLPTLYFFYGLVLGSLPIVIRQANDTGFRLSYIVGVTFGLASLLFAGNLLKAIGADWALLGSGLSLRIFQGALVGFSLVVPGLSVSFILLAFGYYEELLGLAARLDFLALAPLALGFLPALMVSSRGIYWLFKKHHGQTSHFILGILLGSLWVAFPGLPRTVSETLLGAGLLGAGALLSSFFQQKLHSN